MGRQGSTWTSQSLGDQDGRRRWRLEAGDASIVKGDEARLDRRPADGFYPLNRAW